MLVDIAGWYSVGASYPDIDRSVLDSKLFKYSVRRFELSNLRLVTIDRIQGSYFNPVYVTGVVDTKGPLNPFFITRQKAKTLQKMIDNQNNAVVSL